MSSKNSNKINVPEARAAMDKFKMEAAAEVGVNLKEGYNLSLIHISHLRQVQSHHPGLPVRPGYPGRHGL